MTDRITDKIYGALIGAAAGDALASATDGKSHAEILEIYGKEVREFITPDNSTLAGGRAAGQFTDAFSIPYFLICELLDSNGEVTEESGIKVLRKWGKSEYFAPFAGMTTRKVVNALNATENTDFWAASGHLRNRLFKGHYYALSSNGAACKAFPLGLFACCNIEEALENTVKVTMTSHDDPLSISGACAVSAAISECFSEEATVFSVVKKALYGASEGEKLGRAQEKALDYPGPSTYKRIKVAQQLALKNSGTDKAAVELRDCIGCGPEIAETVPAAMGLVIARKDKPLEALYDAVNIGDETCAISCIAGALTGAFYGSSVFPERFIEVIEKNNAIDLMSTAEKIADIAKAH